MNLPKFKPFSQDIAVQFPPEESVPEQMEDWWTETRENLNRLKDKISILEQENQILKRQISSILERL